MEKISLTRKHWQMISAYSLAHFLVDFACAFLMFSTIAHTPDWYTYILVYNFCAFALQMPLGILADRWNRNHLFALIGCALVGAAYGLGQIPLIAVVVVGIGNGMFHVGGGVDVLNVSEKKAGALGVFVSPGALGLFLGTLLGKDGTFPFVAVFLALLIGAILIETAYLLQEGSYPKNPPFSLSAGDLHGEGASHSAGDLHGTGASHSTGVSRAVLVGAACFFLVVVLRSYIGLSLAFPWKGIGYWGFTLVLAVVFGKALGGFASDRFGAQRTAGLSLAGAAVLFLIPQFPVAGILSVLLFNMTMPITLWALARAFPAAKGFSFGLLTFGLFLGFLPVHLGSGLGTPLPWIFALGALISLALLLLGLRKVKT